MARNARQYRRLTAIMFAASALLLTAFVISYSGFDGVAFAGLNMNAGHVKRGREFAHTIVVYNLTFRQVPIMVVPTCGCAVDRVAGYTVEPMSARRIPIRYLIISKASNPMERDVIIVYSCHGSRTKVTGKIHFILS